MKAFPRADGKFDSRKRDELGMDLRDYFAAKAMQGYMNDGYDYDPVQVAKQAYTQADIMMKVRQE
jgi:hypothetical protein